MSDIKSGDLTVCWRKAFHEDDIVPRDFGQDTIALSAFNLSSQPNNIARKTLVKEMWNSGAHTLVSILVKKCLTIAFSSFIDFDRS